MVFSFLEGVAVTAVDGDHRVVTWRRLLVGAVVLVVVVAVGAFVLPW